VIAARRELAPDAAGFISDLECSRVCTRRRPHEARAEGIEEEDIGPNVGRPESSLAKVLDECNYLTITRGWKV
jgi:hypothetical protein